jgi:RNA polymerase sigma factor (sigma-70 family)
MHRSIRHILIDGIRKQNGRPEHRRAFLDRTSMSAATQEDGDPVFLVRDAMARMKLRRPRQARVVAMRHLEGYTIEECARRLGISDRTVKRDSAAASEWLRKELAA